MEPFQYGTSEDGEYAIVSLTQDTLNGAMEVIRKAFFTDENICKAVELSKSPKAMRELEELTIRAAEDGCSIVAIERKTGVVASVAFNKIQVPAVENEENYFENFERRIAEPSSKALVRFMIEADAECDVFQLTEVDCLLEVMFAATLREHRGKGLCKKLYHATGELCGSLMAGVDRKVPINGKSAAEAPVPRMVASIFTTFITQLVGKRLDFKEASVMSYDRWSFNGKSFAERIGPDSPNAVVAYFML